MSRAKNFNDFSYGVGLEYNASSYKQVKDQLKGNLDGLLKMANAYSKMLEVDPSADFSQILKELKETRQFIDQIKNSGNPFSEFIDKGVLSRIATLEKGVQTLIEKVPQLGDAFKTTFGEIKDIGGEKFSGTFDKIFADKSGKINSVSKEIRDLQNEIKNFEKLSKKANPKGIDSLLIDDNISDKTSIEEVKQWIAEWESLLERYGNIDYDGGKDQIQLVKSMQDTAAKISSALDFEKISKALSGDKIDVNKLRKSLNQNIIAAISGTLEDIKNRKASLEAELKDLQSIQDEYLKSQQNNSSGKVVKSDALESETPIKLTPKVVPSEWAKIINDKLKVVQDQLDPVILKPTFSNSSKNLEKDIQGNAATIKHIVKAEFELDDNDFQKSFNEKIKNIDISLQHARNKLATETKFKLGWEWEDGERFKDIVYPILNQFKNVPVTFKVANGKSFMKTIDTIKQGVIEKLTNIGATLDNEKVLQNIKEIPIGLKISNKNAILLEIDNIRSEIETKLKNIGIGLQLLGINEQPIAPTNANNIDNQQSVINQSIDNTPKKIEAIGNLSDKSRKKVEQLKAELKDLDENFVNSKTFITTGVLDQYGKKKDDESQQLKAKVDRYNELVEKRKHLTEAQAKEAKQLQTYLKQVLTIQEAYKKSQLDTLLAKSTTKVETPKVESKTLDETSNKIKQNTASAEELKNKIKEIQNQITSLETKKFDSEFLVSGKNKDKITEQVAKYKQLLPVEEHINHIIHTQNTYLDKKIKKLETELAIQQKIAGSTTNAFKIAKSYYETNSKLKGKQQDNAANKMLTKVLNTTVGGNSTFSFVINDKDINNLERYTPLARTYDEILQKIGYHLSDLQPVINSEGKQFGFTAKAIAIPDKAIKSYHNAKTILMGTSKSASEAETEVKKLNAQLSETKAARDSLKKDGVNSKTFTELGNITSQGKKQGEDITSIISRYKELEKVESSLEQTRKRRIKTTSTELASLKQQLKDVNKPVTSNVEKTVTNISKTTQNKLNTENQLNKEKDTVNTLNNILSSEHVEAMNKAVAAEEEKRKKSEELTKQLIKERDVLRELNKLGVKEKTSSGKTKDADTSVASAKISRDFTGLQSTALSAITDSSILEKAVVGMKPLKDGIVEVSGVIKDGSNQWKSYTLQIDKNNQVSKFEVKNNQSIIKAYLERAKAVDTLEKKSKTLGNNPSDKAEKQLKVIDELLGRINEYTSQNNLKFDKQGNLSEYFANLQNIKTQLQNTLNMSPTDRAKYTDSEYNARLDNLVARAKDAAKQIQQELDKSIRGDNLNRVGKLNAAFKGLKINSTNPSDIFNQMSQAAQNYGKSLDGAIVKIQGFNANSNQMTFSITDTNGAIHTFVMSLRDGTGAVEVIEKSIKGASTSLLTLQKSLVKSLFSMSKYIFGMYSGWYTLVRMIKNGITSVKELDAAMTELKKVTDESAKTYKQFLKDASLTANEIGSTLVEFVNATADFARLGYSIKEASNLAKVASIYTNIGDDVNSIDDATESIISTMKAFDIEAESAISIVDKFNEVGNRFAITSGGIGDALQRSASALYEAGNTLDESIALITTANSVVQNPEIVGTALKTLSLRLRGAKTELEEASLDTDAMATSVSSLRDKLLGLTSGKVDIMKNANEFKNTTEILREMSQVWEDMTDIQQAAALELMGGKRQANILSAIISNFDTVESVIQTALNSTNSAYIENEKYLDSIQGRLDKFNNAQQTMWANFISSGLIKGFVDAGTTIVETLNKIGVAGTLVISAMLLPALLSLTKGFNTWFKDTEGTLKLSTALKNSFKGLGTIITNVKNFILGLIAPQKILTGATLKDTLAQKGLKKEFIEQIFASAGLTASTAKLTKEQIKNAGAAFTAQYQQKKLTAAQYLASMSTLGLGQAFKGLINIIKANPMMGVAGTFVSLALLFNKLYDTVDETADKTKEAFEEMSSTVDQTKSTIQSLEDELSTVQSQIDALEGKNLSFVDNEELKRLKKQREQLEHSKKVQEQLLEAQQQTSDKQAVAAMKAYTNATAKGAEETRKLYQWGGAALGAVLGVAAVLAAAPTGGASLALLGAGALIGGSIGQVGGTLIGDQETSNTYDSWYETYAKALDAAREDEQKALEKYQKDTSNIDKLNKWQEAQEKTTEIETEMYEHLSQMQSYYNGLEYGRSEELDQELDRWYNFLDKFSIQELGKDAKVNALDRIFGENASATLQAFREEMESTVAIGDHVNFTEADAEVLGLADTLKYLGITVQDVENYFNDTGKAAESAAASSSKFSNVISEIAKSESALKSLSSAMEEFQKEGSVSASTLDGMDDSIKSLGDAWENYVQVMLSGNATMADAYTVTQALAQAFLDAYSNEITAENKLAYIAQLQKLGVENAKEVIESYVNNDFFNSSVISEQAIQFRKWVDEIKEASDEWNKLTNGNIDYNNRPILSKKDMLAAGWSGEDIEDNQIVTTYTIGYDKIQDKNGNVFSLDVSPILDNGDVLSPAALNDYVNNVLSGAEDIKQADKDGYGILVQMKLEDNWDDEYWNQFEDSLLESKQNHEMAVQNAAQGLVDLAAEKGIVLELGDAYEILALKENYLSLQQQKHTAERIKLLNAEKTAAKTAWDTINSISDPMAKSEILTLINDIKAIESDPSGYAETHGGIFGPLSEDKVKSRLEAYKTALQQWASIYGFSIEDVFRDFDSFELEPEIEAPSDAEINAAEKAIQKKLDAMQLSVTPKLDLNPQDVIEDLSDIESGFKSISEVYNEFKEKGIVSASSLAGLKEAFDVVGISDEYEKFITVLGNSASTISQVQSAVYDLASAYLNTIRITDQLTDAEKALIVEQLKRIGVVNAEEWVESRVEAYEYIWENCYETDLNKYDTLEEAKVAIAVNAIAAKMNIESGVITDLANQYSIDLSNFTKKENGKIRVAKEAAAEIAKAYAATEAQKIYSQGLAGIDKYKQSDPQYWVRQENLLTQQYKDNYDKFQKQALEDISGIELVDPDYYLKKFYNPNINVDFNKFGSLGSGGNSSSAEDTAEQTIDFIEIKLEEIEKLIAKATARVENIIDDTSQSMLKRAAYDDLISAQKQKAQVSNSAASYYSQKAASLLAAVPSQYREMAKNGAIAVEDFLGESQTEIADAIEKYREYDAKADDAEIAALEAIAEVSALRLQAIQDIADDFDNVIGLIDAKSGLLQSNMDLVEESGIRMAKAYYDELIKGANDTIAQLTEKQLNVRQDLNDAVRSGEIVVGSDDWYEAVNLIMECDEEIVNCKQDIEEWNNAINDLKWDNLEKFITELDNVNSQLSHLYDLLSDDADVVDDMGKWTDKGITSLGLLAQQLELAQYKSQQYSKAIQELQEDYAAGRYSTDEYNEKLAELTENQWDSIEAYEQAKKAIVDLNKVRVDAVKDGIQKEIDAYKKLIDAKKESLDVDKEARDFERDVAEKQKNIAVIQRQLAALANNNTAEANAKRKQLQAELLAANTELEEFYYNHSIDTQKDALDKEYDSYEQNKQDEMDALDEWLKQQEAVIQESFDIIKANAETVLATIRDTANEYGVQISDAITEPWKNNETALSDYSGVFNSTIGNLSAAVDAFIGKLNELLNKQNEIINSANDMANSVIDSTNQSFANATESQNVPVTGWDPYGGPNFSDTGSGSWGSSGENAGSSNIQVGGKINAGNAPIYDNIGATPEKQYFKNDPIYTVLKENGDWIQVRWHKASSGVTGWFKKSDVSAYAKGTLGTQKDQLALIDELGEELQLVPNGTGRLAYMKKGTSVVPADLTQRLMEWGELDPTEALNQSRPKLGAPHITTNNFNIDMSFGSLVHVDAVSNDTLPELQKMVKKEFDSLMKGLNNSVKRYTR